MRLKDLLAVPKKEYSKEQLKIERWYDRSSKNWIVQLLDPEGNQVGNAIYVYSKKEANAITKEDFN